MRNWPSRVRPTSWPTVDPWARIHEDPGRPLRATVVVLPLVDRAAADGEVAEADIEELEPAMLADHPGKSNRRLAVPRSAASRGRGRLPPAPRTRGSARRRAPGAATWSISGRPRSRPQARRSGRARSNGSGAPVSRSPAVSSAVNEHPQPSQVAGDRPPPAPIGRGQRDDPGDVDRRLRVRPLPRPIGRRRQGMRRQQDQRVEDVLPVDLHDLQLRQEELGQGQRRMAER